MDAPSQNITLLPDGTVNFLPVRLNRQPIIVLGLTADEMFATAAISAVVGILLGIPMAFLFKAFAMLPTMLLLCIAVGVFTGGRLLRRLKRGRPETWLYREMQWRLVNRFPSLTTWLGGKELINRSGLWSHRRGHSL
ncbi:conjugative transfer region protein [Pseudomonas luteola]|uniref:Conjugative transfer region protein n=1 Tax=Pseudomonas luteola TaxID=47886 RepID=A0A2X2C5I4_PSELU|nr:TIGR03750 family conjugal transfer protein [Pseudomonas luteola]SPZ02568.1 conjugative transfer region protein [Pseudomonas luteola]